MRRLGVANITRTRNAREGLGLGEIVSSLFDILNLSIYGYILVDMPNKLLNIWVQSSGKFWDSDKLSMSYGPENPCLISPFRQVSTSECYSQPRILDTEARHWRDESWLIKREHPGRKSTQFTNPNPKGQGREEKLKAWAKVAKWGEAVNL